MEKKSKWSIENWITLTAIYLAWADERIEEAKGELASICQNIKNYIEFGLDPTADDKDRKRYFQVYVSKQGKHLSDWPDPSDKWAGVEEAIIKVKNDFIAMRSLFHTKVFNLEVKDPSTGKMAKICHIFDVRSTKGDNKEIYHHDLESYLITKLDSDEKGLLKRLKNKDWLGTRADLFKKRERVVDES